MTRKLTNLEIVVSMTAILSSGGCTTIHDIGDSSETGGVTNTGGSPATGGIAPAMGGTSAIGGATQVTGGSLAAGGTAAATGGTRPTGGSPAIDGGSSVDQRPGAPCKTASDCQLLNDCCSCDVYSAAATLESCPAVCKDFMCNIMGIGISDVACIAGRCVLSRSCDLNRVTCDRVLPECPEGQVPSVQGSCYGPCLPVGRCGDVTSCDVCTAANLDCVTLTSDMPAPTYHCVIRSQGCSAEPDCNCMGVCTAGFVCSGTNPQVLACVCPAC